MTREMTSYKRAGKYHRAENKKTANEFFKSVGIIVSKTVNTYRKVVAIKRDVSDKFVSFSEVLADKTAREGLFGEDRGKGYCGTDTDYIA
ncbi:MAG: hypothetical protein IKI97_09285 [Clostridia bacterium]|nr:hypothetical protein [Clostridia bacterium]